jgi:hypothetical protein
MQYFHRNSHKIYLLITQSSQLILKGNYVIQDGIRN